MSKRTDWILSSTVLVPKFNEERMEALQAAGIRNIELTGTGTNHFADLDFLHTAKKQVAFAASYGVTIRTLHLPFVPFERIDPACLDASVRDNFVQVQSEIMRAGADAGICTMIVHPSGEPYEQGTRATRLGHTIDSLGRLLHVADECGVTLCCENLPRTCMCSYISEMQTVLSALPNLAACFDFNHSLYDDNEAYLRAIAPRVRALHVSDYDGIDERHWLPMQGKNDWNALMTVLEESGYEGYFNYEVSSAHPSEIAENFRALMEK